MPIRLPVPALVLLAGLTCGVVAIVTASGNPATVGHADPAGPGRAAGAAPTGSGRPDALAVLHAWDLRRSAAWARGDVRALEGLYVPGSSEGVADARLLRRYLARGYVVRGMRMQVFTARVLTARPAVLRLEVTDRLAGAIAVRGASRRPLPSGTPARRLVVLRRVDGTWLVARVRSTLP